MLILSDRHPDSYHSCYTLTGLSTIQHYHYYTEQQQLIGGSFGSSFSWESVPAKVVIDADDGVGGQIHGRDIISKCDRLVAFHPLYTIPHKNAEALRKWCEERPV